MSPAWKVEWLKLRRSRVTLTATALLAAVLPAMGLAFYQVAISDGSGIVAAKAAAFLSEPGWVGYLGMIDQIAAVAMFLGAGIIVAWVFGREHSDRTFPSLFALSVSRESIARAKLGVLALWLTLVSILVVTIAWILGLVARVGDVAADELTGELAELGLITLLAALLALTVGIVASIGRGYLPAIGALILIIVAAQVAVLFGTGGWFPFAVPGLLAVAGAEGVTQPTLLQVGLVPLLIVVTASATVWWWRNAEVV